jgi:hypothetical protein
VRARARARGQFKYKPDFFLMHTDSRLKQNHFAGGYGGDTYNRITVKFLTDEDVKPAGILMRLRAQFGNEMLSGSQVCD